MEPALVISDLNKESIANEVYVMRHFGHGQFFIFFFFYFLTL